MAHRSAVTAMSLAACRVAASGLTWLCEGTDERGWPKFVTVSRDAAMLVVSERDCLGLSRARQAELLAERGPGAALREDELRAAGPSPAALFARLRSLPASFAVTAVLDRRQALPRECAEVSLPSPLAVLCESDRRCPIVPQECRPDLVPHLECRLPYRRAHPCQELAGHGLKGLDRAFKNAPGQTSPAGMGGTDLSAGTIGEQDGKTVCDHDGTDAIDRS